MIAGRSTDSGNGTNEALLDLFGRHGLARAEPAILQPAEIFLDLSGEDIRRRLYLVQDPEGRELCLRPDYTIPVSRDHLRSTSFAAAMGYCYLGPVFRYRPGQAAPGEFLQAGVERFGEADSEKADADVLALALEAVALAGLERPMIRLGDPGLFMAFVAALALPEPWPRRLRGAFGREGSIAQVLSPAPTPEPEERATFLGILGTGDREAARAAVEEMMAVAGIAPIGGRSAGEIAERLLEKAQLSLGGGPDSRARQVLLKAANVRGSPDEALDAFESIAREEGLELHAALNAFRRRLDLMAERGVPVSEIGFAADFGRRLDYYTGYVFEIYDPARPDGQIVGGGRYDRLLSMLGAPQPVPAVGCSIWIDRLAGGLPR